MLRKAFDKLKKINEKLLLHIFKAGVLVECMMHSIEAYALESTQAVQGTKRLLEDGSKVMLIVEAAALIVLEIKQLIQWQIAEEPQVKVRHVKKAGEILLIGGIIIAVNGIVTAVLSYYK